MNEVKINDLCDDTATIFQDERGDGQRVVAVVFQDSDGDVVAMHYDVTRLQSLIEALSQALDALRNSTVEAR